MLKITVAVSVFVLTFSLGLPARGQSMERLAADPWTDGDLAVTYDHPIFENTGHVKNTGYDTHLNVWDSYGRVRLNRKDDNSPFVAYRIFTGNIGTDLPAIHSTLDEFLLAGGFHLGEVSGWKFDTLLGVGYSGTHPFLNEKGIFGVGDFMATRQITANTSLLLSIDYAGNSQLLSDMPLPGFAIIHRESRFSFELGFPDNQIQWQPIDAVTLTARYSVPYTASLDVEYVPWQHFGFYAQAANFFDGFIIAKENSINREFLQMRRVEAGIRLIYDPLVDASLGIGYAFDQSVSTGFDVRSLRPIAQLSNAPYIALVLRGTF